MTSKYLLDTNVISDSMRPRPNPNVLEKLKIHQLEIATATVVIHELLYGCWRLPESKRRTFFEQYLEDLVLTLPLFDYDLKSARYHARERVRLSKIGTVAAFADGHIASIAVTNDLVLVTNNVTDFQDFEGIEIENWFDLSRSQ